MVLNYTIKLYMLSAWLLGVLLHVIAYARGGWKKKQIRAIEAELAAKN